MPLSHCSATSLIPLPQTGAGCTHWHDELHFCVPVQPVMPSHCSGGSILPFPHSASGTHLHESHRSDREQLAPDSHCSGGSTLPLPQTGAGGGAELHAPLLQPYW